jgi:hypothetical protein
MWMTGKVGQGCSFGLNTSKMFVAQRRRRVYRVTRGALFLGCALFAGIITLSILSDKLLDGFGCESPCTSKPSRHHQRHVIADHHNATTATLFPLDKPLVIVSISYHESPIQDLIDLLTPLGVRFVEKGIDTYGCGYFNSCRSSGHRIKDWVGFIWCWYLTTLNCLPLNCTNNNYDSGSYIRPNYIYVSSHKYNLPMVLYRNLSIIACAVFHWKAAINALL